MVWALLTPSKILTNRGLPEIVLIRRAAGLNSQPLHQERSLNYTERAELFSKYSFSMDDC
jgi:hypothetical protein